MGKECPLKTSIGGQAVIEGVMMRGPKEIAVAVRKSDGEIVIDKKDVKATKVKLFKLPFIRGVVNFFSSLVVGVKALMFSAEFFDIEDDGDEEPSKFDKWLTEHLGDKLKDIAIYFSVVVSLIFSIGLFILLPAYITGFLKNAGMGHAGVIIIEGVLRIAIFLGYLILVSRAKDIQRVFEYHGAEHKSIYCYEHGDKLSVENVKNYSRLHPRCGTSFLFIVMIISIIVFFFIKSDVWYLRLVYRLLLLPVVAGVSYEIIKLAGRCDNKFSRVISKPGMWLQYFTTREPSDDQIEVAIASLNAVIPENREDAKW